MLAAHGAVSAQVAVAMAARARARFGSAVAVSVTGVAGPDGGTAAKPVGLTYVGIDDQHGTDVRRFVFAGDRAGVREAATREALTWLIERAEGATP
jgi:PncC family amidohydrolase